MDNDAAAQQPVQPIQQPVPDEPETPAEPQEAPEQVEDPQETEVPSQPQPEGAEAPESTAPEEATEEDFDPMDSYGNYQQGEYQFKPAEDGSVDPYQVATQIEQRLLNTMKFQQQEQRAWQKIDKKYGETLTPRRREMILNARIANAVNGKQTNLTKLADEIMSEFTTAKSEGRAQAGISHKVQKAASLETATSNTGPDRSNDDKFDRIMSGDNRATEDLISEWLKAGKI